MIWKSKEYIAEKTNQLRGIINRSLIIVQFTDSTVIDSFVGRKLKMAEILGVNCGIYRSIELSEERALEFLRSLIIQNPSAGIIVQLPLPVGWNVSEFMDTLSPAQDIDLLTERGYGAWLAGAGFATPPVVYAVATALDQAGVSLECKTIVVCGHGKLVGRPVCDWLEMQLLPYSAIDIHTDLETKKDLLVNADIIISGTGSPLSITPNDIRTGVILIDCGTSSDAGVLQGDIHPDCAEKAVFMTSTPGGIGPLTVLGVFENLRAGIQ